MVNNVGISNCIFMLLVVWIFASILIRLSIYCIHFPFCRMVLHCLIFINSIIIFILISTTFLNHLFHQLMPEFFSWYDKNIIYILPNVLKLNIVYSPNGIGQMMHISKWNETLTFYENINQLLHQFILFLQISGEK